MMNKGKVIALAIALVVVMSAFVVIATQSPISGGQAKTGDDPNNGDTPVVPALTTITAAMTAVGYWEKVTSYEWTLEKVYVEDELAQANAKSGIPVLEIEPGESALINFDITAKRSGPICYETNVARGVVAVTNTGSNPTDDLAITATVQGLVDGVWVDLATVQVNTAVKPVLGAGECYEYAYEVMFDECNYADLRAIACATITNFDGHSGEIYGVEACAEFCLPGEMTCKVINDRAILSDRFDAPCGFVYEVLCYDGPWELCGDDNVWTFSVSYLVTNVDAPRNSCYILNNQAKLWLWDGCSEIVSCAQVKIYTGDLETTLDVGMTIDDIYWDQSWGFQFQFDDDDASYLVSTNGETDIVDPTPTATIEQILVVDRSYFIVYGYVTVTNTGEYATEGLVVTNTIQMLNLDSVWVDVASVNVNTSSMPVLCPGESYNYPYCISFEFDGIAMAPQKLFDVPFRSVVFAGICNYDDDAAASVDGGVYYYSPLNIPLKQDLLCIETKGEYTHSEVVPLSQCGSECALVFDSRMCYEQTIVIRNYDDRTTIDSCTAITGVTLVTFQCCCMTDCREIETSFYHTASTVLVGEENSVVLQIEGTTWDNETLPICVLCTPTDMNIVGLLYYEETFQLFSSANAYAIGNEKILFLGVLATFQIPDLDAAVEA